MSQLTSTMKQKEFTLENLRHEKKSIKEKVYMMRPDTLSADMLEERSRYILGYKHQDELVILYNQAK